MSQPTTNATDARIHVTELVLAEQTLPVVCRCGKRYRLGAEYAGQWFRCQGCGAPLGVPGKRQPSSRASHNTRLAVLSELGIDPQAAEAAYWDGVLKTASDAGRQTQAIRSEKATAQAPHSEEALADSGSGDATMRPSARAALLGLFLLCGLSCFLFTLVGLSHTVALSAAVTPALLSARAIYLG